jgi:hypothetical protein
MLLDGQIDELRGQRDKLQPHADATGSWGAIRTRCQRRRLISRTRSPIS